MTQVFDLCMRGVQQVKLSLRMFYILQTGTCVRARARPPRIACRVHPTCAGTHARTGAAIWVYTCFMHRFVDGRRKDYYVMCARAAARSIDSNPNAVMLGPVCGFELTCVVQFVFLGRL